MEFDTWVRVNGTVDDTAWKAGGTEGIRINDLMQLKEGAFGGNVTFSAYADPLKSAVIQNDLDIRGTLFLDHYGSASNTIRCGNHTISVGNLILNSKRKGICP